MRVLFRKCYQCTELTVTDNELPDKISKEFFAIYYCYNRKLTDTDFQEFCHLSVNQFAISIS